MVTILRNDHSFLRIDKNSIENKVQKALENLELSDHELTIAFVSNKKIRRLKNFYLGIDESTDVLSFRSGDINPETGRNFLGDIIISPRKAKDQAKKNNLALETELLTLCIHGLLHLLDYDHATVKDEEKMFEFQNELLKEIISR